MKLLGMQIEECLRFSAPVPLRARRLDFHHVIVSDFSHGSRILECFRRFEEPMIPHDRQIALPQIDGPSSGH